MSKRSRRAIEQIERVKCVHGVTEYRIPRNGLRVLFAPRRGTGVVTTNIMYFVGSRDEDRGETGLAHMLEHMLFKPTSFDRARKTESASMVFERECGVVLNANTWKDRTTYYFSYPKKYLDRALRIEAERMQNLVLTEKEFMPERTNVLSEFDMYAGDPEFALSVEMNAAAFHSHTYGHETIGFREDIAAYTVEQLRAFYGAHYAPRNAVLMLVGDLTETEMKRTVTAHFGRLTNPAEEPRRYVLTEPTQEGLRTVTVARPSETRIYAVGVKHAGFPKREWYLTMVALDLLAGGKDSVLHRALVDTGLATRIDSALEPTKDDNLAIIYVTAGAKTPLPKLERAFANALEKLTLPAVAPYLKKIIAKSIAGERATRENSLGYVAELTEYVSAGEWEAFFKTEEILRSFTPREALAHLKTLFRDSNTTVGRFIGTKANV